jgi:uncharacterized protein
MRQFEWDAEKNKLNIEKHKLSFDIAKRLFEKKLDVIVDDRIEYNEKRYIGFGELDKRLMMVVFTMRKPGKIRLISFRKANAREQKEYYANKLD